MNKNKFWQETVDILLKQGVSISNATDTANKLVERYKELYNFTDNDIRWKDIKR